MLKPGDPAPPFDLECALDGRTARCSLAKISSELVLIFFYPRDFSFICPTEVTGFNKALKDFAAEDTAIVGVSIDNVDSHLRWARELGGIGYPMLADPDGSLARAYGVFDENEKVALRATFILDRKRKVAYSLVMPAERWTQRQRDASHRARAPHRPTLPRRLEAGRRVRSNRSRLLGRAWPQSIPRKNGGSSSGSRASAKLFSACRTAC